MPVLVLHAEDRIVLARVKEGKPSPAAGHTRPSTSLRRARNPYSMRPDLGLLADPTADLYSSKPRD